MYHLPVEAHSSGGDRRMTGTCRATSGGPMSPESFGRLVHVLRAAIARTDVLRGFFSSQSIVLPVTAGRP